MYTFPDRSGARSRCAPRGPPRSAAPTSSTASSASPSRSRPTPSRRCTATRRPRAGRFREHWQCSVEAIGSADPAIDAEVIQLYVALLRAARRRPTSSCGSTRSATPTAGPPTSRASKPGSTPTTTLLDEEARHKRRDRARYRSSTSRTRSCARRSQTHPKIGESLCGACREHFDERHGPTSRRSASPTCSTRRSYAGSTTTRARPSSSSRPEGSTRPSAAGAATTGWSRQIGGPPTPGIGFGAGIERLAARARARGRQLERAADRRLLRRRRRPARAAARSAMTRAAPRRARLRHRLRGPLAQGSAHPGEPQRRAHGRDRARRGGDDSPARGGRTRSWRSRSSRLGSAVTAVARSAGQRAAARRRRPHACARRRLGRDPPRPRRARLRRPPRRGGPRPGRDQPGARARGGRRRRARAAQRVRDRRRGAGRAPLARDRQPGDGDRRDRAPGRGARDPLALGRRSPSSSTRRASTRRSGSATAGSTCAAPRCSATSAPARSWSRSSAPRWRRRASSTSRRRSWPSRRPRARATSSSRPACSRDASSRCPQSPQIYKQLLVISGFERYYQIARCFRDEDLRADRLQEITQLDVEMAFPDREFLFGLIERIMRADLARAAGASSSSRRSRASRWEEADLRYGSDKPDLRFGLEIEDATELTRGSGFRVFADAPAVRFLRVPQELSRGELASSRSSPSSGARRGSPTSSTAPRARAALPDREVPRRARSSSASRCDRRPHACSSRADAAGDGLAGARRAAPPARPRARADRRARRRRFLWVTDFPMFEWDAENGRWDAVHHPFTRPNRGERGAARQRPGRREGDRLRPGRQRDRDRGRLLPDPRARAAGEGVRAAATSQPPSSSVEVRLPARRARDGRAAARRDRLRDRPAC